jgi:hypothetical protein
MSTVSDITAVHITLETGGKQALFILLAADGSINRLGSGSVTNTDNDLFIGITKEPLFAKLMAHLDNEMLKYMGGYDIPDQRGVPCKLSIGLAFANEEENGFGFRYGSQSQGPPDEIVQIVTAALQLTNPWFQQQKGMVSKSKAGTKKPWWKLW